MLEAQVADLQVAIIVVALIMGAARGVVGYWLLAPDTEKWSWNKFGKTVVRYALFNLASVNGIAVAGQMVWTVAGVIAYTFAQLALEVGFDVQTHRAVAKAAATK